MRRQPTKDPNIKILGDTYYYRRGRDEISLKVKVPDFAAALKKKKFIEAAIEETGSDALKFKVGDLYPEYLEEKRLQKDGKLKKKKRISEGTFKEIGYAFDNHLLPFFGNDRLGKINERRWSQYINQATVSDLSNHRKAFSGFLKWCKRKGYLRAIPDVTEIPHHERRQRYIIKPHEIKLIFQHAHGSLLLFLSLALFNGLRRQEIITLKWEGVSFSERYITVEKQFNKKRRGREIPINDLVFSLLAAHQREVRSSPWVFPNAKDRLRHADVRGLKTAWYTCLEKCGFRRKVKNPDVKCGYSWEVEKSITWHDFRATYEKYAHKSKEHTDTQKEKFADASIDVQKKIYVSMGADDLRGLEDVVQVDGLTQLIEGKNRRLGNSKGKTDAI